MKSVHRVRRALQPPLRALIYGAFLIVTALLRLIGARAARRVGRMLGAAAGALLPWEGRVADRQLAAAFPELDGGEHRRIRRAMFRHFGESAVELLYAERVLQSPGNLEVIGLDDLVAAAAGAGAIIVTGHIGNWELLGPVVAARHRPVMAIARRIYDPRLDRWMRSWRERMRIDTLVRDDPGAVKGMLRTLKSRGVLGLLIDQDTDVESCWVPFFGRPAKTPTAAARLARRGTPLFVAAARRVGPFRHRLEFRRVAGSFADDATLTAELNRRLEALIRLAPEQWVWHHRRWKSPPP